MKIERRALYNLLRMNWQLDPNIDVEPWQIENYRGLPEQRLFDMLEKFHINMDHDRFIAYSESSDTPEELTEYLVGDSKASVSTQDQIYLIVFELWRRLIPEKPSLSVFCDELDHQINLFDQGKVSNFEALQDAIANLQTILDENVDEGGEPQEVFETICAGCAHDVESFLYDFIAEQIDVDNHSYGEELLDAFTAYINDTKWFDFLRVQIAAASDKEDAEQQLQQLVEEYDDTADLEFYLELLSFMVREGDKDLFIAIVKKAIPFLEGEYDFQDLLSTCSDFCHYLDLDEAESEIQQLISQRENRTSTDTIDRKDPAIAKLIQILEKSLRPHKLPQKS